MALRRWRTAPGLWVENRETGDGRVFAPGCVSWDAGMTLPLAWMRDGDQHVDLSEMAPQIGVIDSAAITRDGDVGYAEGWIDDANPDGAELIRRLEAGAASHGDRQGVSIDPDNWSVQVLVSNEGDDEMVMLASVSGSGRFPTGAELRAMVGRSPVSVRAAVGDPDPGENPEGRTLLFVDSADFLLGRFTRARLRGATCCAVPAFSDALIELAPVEAEAAPEDDAAPPAEDVTAAIGESGPELYAVPTFNVATSTRAPRPPADWFDLPEPAFGATGDVDLYGMPVEELIVEQPDGQYGVPLTIVERHDGLHQVFGNGALWGSCHRGYPGECVTPPDSPSGYAHFHLGEVICAGGERRAVGPLTVGTDHAAARLLAPEARDHYANTGLTFADVRTSDGVFGPWVAGVCRPLTDDQLAVVRASSLSGDWRRIATDLDLVAWLAVAVPGFAIARALMAAAGVSSLVAAMPSPSVAWDDGEVLSLVAAGIVQRCRTCGEHHDDERDDPVLVALDTISARLDVLERRTRPTRDLAASALLDRIRGNGH